MPRKKTAKLMKFGDMHYGQWFRDHHGRTFVKMQNVLPSGIRIIYRSFAIESIPEGQDARHAIPGHRCSALHFNAIDQDGIPGSCPDWVVFEIIKAPYKQTVRHDGEGIDGGCRACQIEKPELIAVVPIKS